jgi:hypothetical protein
MLDSTPSESRRRARADGYAGWSDLVVGRRGRTAVGHLAD